jgi:spermidine/putrescine transport system substrate-binding protein
MILIAANTFPPGASLDLIRRKAWPEHRVYDTSKDEDGSQTLYGMVKNIGNVTIDAGEYKVIWILATPAGAASYETTGSVDLAPKEVTILAVDIPALELSIGKYHVETTCYYYGIAGKTEKTFTFKASRLPVHPDVTGTLEVFEWAGYEVEELWGTFKTMYPNVDVKFSFFINEAEALTKLMAGYRPDIVHPRAYNVRRWYDAGVIDPLDTSLIPNWNDIFDDMKLYCEENTMFKGQHYFCPTDWGYSTILYRPDLLEDLGIPKKDPVTGEENWDTYNLLFDYKPELEGKIMLTDAAVEVFPMAAMAAGVPTDGIWNMTDAQLDLVKAKLEEGKPLVSDYWTTEQEVAHAMETGQIVAANIWGESFITLRDEGINVTYSNPEQGRILWTCGFNIVEGLKNRKPELWEAAHAFMNAWLDPTAGAWLIDNYGYGSTNSLAPASVKNIEMMKALGLDNAEIIAKSIFWKYTPNEEEWVRIWNEYRG